MAKKWQVSSATLTALRNAWDDLNAELTDLNDAYEDMSERWQEGEKGEEVRSFLDDLESCLDDLDNAISATEDLCE